MSRIFTAADGHTRCAWADSAPDFLRYHDEEWGYPVGEDIRLFEKVCLESFQSGLSWRTILDKRENFRAAFAGFDFNKMAEFGVADVERLLQDKGIIRHRGKIEAVINNAARAQELVAEAGSLAAFFWSFEPKAEDLPEPQTVSTSPESVALSKALKKRGWKFVGPTTAFAFMQAMGLINDHARGCICRERAAAAREAFTVPQTKSAA
ncbi:DNA-3-methyladenine glycosylase I [Leisingera sp. ANG-M6]|uniref:DNA-3-methyladenine glycosylase I n=1 Tax=Leisingera sp. ANG-M6 TaxID=1577900 RepID=UPI00057DA24C|nr:DNA-3-methyladenine glycosylase I [Leisingera sp. ANG-M6]KIC29258.1 3-methyladenine DNA glycosylase [Leisingera sp. ANG-M6]